MEIKGIDISSYQKKPDWKKVKADGIQYAILRITQRFGIDTSFEYNYSGCLENKIKIGVYKFSYALSVSDIQAEARDVIQTLKGRKLDFPVWLDLEWKNQRSLSSSTLSAMIKAFRAIIVEAGYEFGIYCNVDWYNNVIPQDCKSYDFWLARYPSNDDGTVQERLRPSNGVAWQYSSKGKVNGIEGNVDMDVFYKDYSSKNDNVEIKKDNTNAMTEDKVIQAMLKVALNEVGYLEKKSNAYLDDKYANAGYNNFTKYWRDVKSEWNGQAWCACYVSWVFMKAFGLEMAKKLLKHWPYVYCPTLGSLFTKHANPKVGDIVIFYRNGEFEHTAIVTKVVGDLFYTVEGNASSVSGITPNGGAVVEKSYYNSNLPGTKFCRPNYSLVTSVNKVETNTSTTVVKNYLELGDNGADVKELQKKLNALGFKGADGKALEVDGAFGDNTLHAVKAAQKKYKLVIDGKAGKNTITALDNAIKTTTSVVAAVGNKYIKQAQIHLNNFIGAKLKITGTLNSATKKAYRKALQKALNADYKCGLEVDGVIGAKSQAALKKYSVKKGSQGILVTVLEIGMLLNKIDPSGVECPGSFGNGLDSAVRKYQKAKKLTVDGIVGYNTLMSLVK